jgi:murein DD-endopeptidase MepM/ murein hydrolase activator NlpD
MPDTVPGVTVDVKKKKITPVTVRGISSPARRSNILPSNIGPARLSGSFQGSLPSNVLLPSQVRVTQGYRPGHTALDLAGPAGTLIYAPERMYVNQAGSGPWGLDVIGTDPDTGNRFTFGHFREVAPGLTPGRIIPKGTLIGYEGSTFTAPGYSTGPHVHLQVNAPGGAAVMPSAQDILNTFISGLAVGAGGKVGEVKEMNTNLLTTSPAVISSQAAGVQVSRAASTGDLGGKVNKTSTGDLGGKVNKTSEGVSSAPPGSAGGAAGLIPRGGAASAVSGIAGANFLASHSSTDYAIMGVGVAAVLFGLVLLYGQIMQGEFNRELNTIDKTSASVGKATEAAGKIAALS